MEIPEKTRFNYINLEAFLVYIKDKYGVSDELEKEIGDFLAEFIRSSIDKERGAWLGKVLKESRNDTNSVQTTV